MTIIDKLVTIIVVIIIIIITIIIITTTIIIKITSTIAMETLNDTAAFLPPHGLTRALSARHINYSIIISTINYSIAISY